MTSLSIYRIAGVNGESKAKIERINTVKLLNKNEEIADTMLSKYEISDGIHGEVWACNLTHNFLFTTKRFPILYSDIWVSDNTNFIRKKICRLTAFFDVIKEPKSYNKFFKKPIKGIYKFGLTIDNKTEIIDDDLKKYPGNKELLQLLINFTQTDEMKKYLNDIALKEIETIYNEKIKNSKKHTKKPKITYSLKEDIENELKNKEDT